MGAMQSTPLMTQLSLTWKLALIHELLTFCENAQATEVAAQFSGSYPLLQIHGSSPSWKLSSSHGSPQPCVLSPGPATEEAMASKAAAVEDPVLGMNQWPPFVVCKKDN